MTARDMKTVDRISAVWKKLGGEDGVSRFLSGELIVTELPQFPLWNTIMIGNLNARVVHQQLETAGIPLYGGANAFLNKTPFDHTPSSLDLVLVSVGELGLEDGGTLEDIYEAAGRHGLSLCPAEVAPQLWLQYPEQVRSAYIGMELIARSDGKRGVYELSNNQGGRGLSIWCPGDYKFHRYHYWVFVRTFVRSKT